MRSIANYTRRSEVARVYLDEDIGAFEQPLVAAGHDVISVDRDESRRGRSDAWHFREAVKERRLLVVWNRGDYEYLHRLWTTLHTLGVVDTPHAGVLTAAPSGAVNPHEWLAPLIAKLDAAEGWAGRLLRWLPSVADWREDKTRPEEGQE